jgi:uncharacterized protein (TIGR03086 family)
MTARDPIDQLSRALDQAGAVIAGVSPQDAGNATPCDAWDVRGLVNHVVHDVHQFTVMATGGRWQQAADDVIGDNWTGAYNQAARALLGAWQRPGALEATVQLPFGEYSATWRVGQQVSDLAVHAWDIAKATGQATNLDPEIGQYSLAWARNNLLPRLRGAAFGPEVRVPAEAPIYDRLAGFFGRAV